MSEAAQNEPPELLDYENLERWFSFTHGQAKGKIQRGVWQKGVQWNKLDGRIMFYREGIREWARIQALGGRETGLKSDAATKEDEFPNTLTSPGTPRIALRPVE